MPDRLIKELQGSGIQSQEALSSTGEEDSADFQDLAPPATRNRESLDEFHDPSAISFV
jgi:hypothetical protein